MKHPTFFEGVGVALVASLTGTALLTGLATVIGMVAALPLVVAGLGLGYVLYLLRRSRERVGRITVVAVWLGSAGTIWLLAPPLAEYLIVHVALLWLVRSLYFHGSLLAALADLALNGLALAAAVWALLDTGSMFLALWCFFLTQALFAYIPASPARTGGDSAVPEDERFEQAYRTAEAALRRLHATR